MSGLYPDLSDKNAMDDKGAEAVELQAVEDMAEETVPIASSGDSKKPSTVYFQDGIRKIDFVLVYTDDAEKPEKADIRKVFEKNLEGEGLELEHHDEGDGTHYVKIHAPWDVLTRVAELIPLKMPIKEYDIEEPKSSLWCFATCGNVFAIDPDLINPHPQEYFTADFSNERQNMFIIEDKDTFFSVAQRIIIVNELLLRGRYDDELKTKFGIDKLIKSGVYDAAFPLHDGPYKSDHSILVTGALNERHLLYETWASPKNWYKSQPLDTIRHYFGEKIAMYFSWLGYYTYMLIPAAIVGFLVFLYGVGSVFSSIPSQEICDADGVGNLTMCPLCDRVCMYWKLKDNCLMSRLTHIFDNYATVLFAAFMAVWSTTFLEFWKRRQAIHQYDWDITQDDDEERIRPEYAVKLKHTRKNPVTQMDEPYLPLWSKVPRYCTSVTVIVFMVFCVLAVVVGVMMYRVIVLSLLYSVAHHRLHVRKAAKIGVSITAAFLNLAGILLLNKLYERLAMRLTKLEFPRTFSEFENSFIFKMFVFQFLNFYTSTFYIAFFKGRVGGRPGDYDYSMGYRAEECDPGGCLIELCIQLGVVMVGKQTLNNFQELMLPKIRNWFRARKTAKKAQRTTKSIRRSQSDALAQLPQWTVDRGLEDYPVMGLYAEYLEMVVQYGFITIFVAAFPLAPFFALLNNFIEIRLDAYKMVTQVKRPVAGRAETIGIWYGILQGITFIGIITNAFIIGWTSDFVPRLVYMVNVSSDHSLRGYVNNSLSYFDVEHFQAQSQIDWENWKDWDQRPQYQNITLCRYSDYREPPISAGGSNNSYEFTRMYWHVFCARLAFVIVFEHFVLFLTWLVAYLIPDVPAYVATLMQRERHLAKEARYDVAFASLHRERDETKRRSQVKLEPSERGSADLFHDTTTVAIEQE